MNPSAGSTSSTDPAMVRECGQMMSNCTDVAQRAQDARDECYASIESNTFSANSGAQPQFAIDPPKAPVVQPQRANVPIPTARPTDPKKPVAKQKPQQPQRQSGFTMADLDREMMSCENSIESAVKSCNDSKSKLITPPASGSDPQSIRSFCSQLEQASKQGWDQNAKLAGSCYSGRSSCSTSCKTSKEKWQNYDCSGDPSCSTSKLQTALEVFNDGKFICENQLEQVERTITAQSSSNYLDSLKSQKCAQTASQKQDPNKNDNSNNNDNSNANNNSNNGNNDASTASNDSGGGMGQALSGLAGMAGNNNNQTNQAAATSDTDCIAYPNSPACGGSADNFNTAADLKETGGSAASLSDFNTGSIDGLPQFPQYDTKVAAAAQGRAIPNGGAGGIPNGGGGSGFGSTGNENGGGQAGGVNTDIEKGLRGGGGYQGNNADPSAISSSGGFGGYGSNSRGYRNKYRGLDLKKYLPGGSKSSAGFVGRSLASTHPDISSTGENMFEKITTRMSLMCKLKQLIGCD
ncbi:MAG: hypothetical protein CL676_12390 [Bdellovibrionaceae bacterium]|nr:hypothetical protein [Pseudobdellovibrionaceae bacterium]|tara:strand:- start:1027 stop:2589 length:1563 start_codon:yes stop_codon:yes gene_type:complete